MITEGKIGVQEGVSLIVITISVKAYFTSPSYLAEVTGTALWYTTLISVMTAMLGFYFICKLISRFPDKDLVQIYKLSLGSGIGLAFSILSAFYLLIINSLFIREFTEVAKTYNLPHTPTSVVIGFVLILISWASFYSFEAIARFARLMAYILLISILLVLLLNINHYEYHNLFPILGYGVGRTIKNGVLRSSFYGEVLILGIFANSIQGADHIKKVGIRALAIAGTLTSALLCCILMAFNYATAQEPISPFYALTRLIYAGAFLQRLDPLFIFSWTIGTLISSTAIFYTSLYTYCNAFKIQDVKPFIIPSAIVTFTISIIPSDLESSARYVNLTRQYGWIIFFILPLIAFITSVLKGRGKRNGS